MLVTAVDHKSKFAVLQAVPRKTEDLVGGVLVAKLEPLADLVLTVTADNGKEFAGHRELADVRFARPYHSWERGLNEHANGLMRQYSGKSGSLLGIDPTKVPAMADLLNGRLRKVPGFRSRPSAPPDCACARRLWSFGGPPRASLRPRPGFLRPARSGAPRGGLLARCLRPVLQSGNLRLPLVVSLRLGPYALQSGMGPLQTIPRRVNHTPASNQQKA